MGEIKDFNPPQEVSQTECPNCEAIAFAIWWTGSVGLPVCLSCGYTVESQAVLEVWDE